MSQEESNLNNVNEEINKYKENVSKLLKLSKIQDNKLDENNKELSSLKKEINYINEINNKTKDLLLLELESNLDKQKQIQIKQDSKVDSFKEIIDLLKEENSNNLVSISSLNFEIGKMKQSIEDKNEMIDSLELKNEELENKILTKDNELSKLGEEIVKTKKEFVERISMLNDEILSQKKYIHQNDESINDLKNIISQKNNDISNLNKDLKILENENSFLGKSMDEKNNNINLLKEEIKVLKSIIHEKEKTIHSLDMGD